MHSWKENNIDPKPDEYNYQLTNFKSNQDDDIIDNYYFFLNLIKYLGSSLITNILIKSKNKNYTRKLIGLSVISYIYLPKIRKNFKNMKKGNKDDQYLMRLLGKGLQETITTPHIFKGSLKDKYFPQHNLFNDNYDTILSEINGLMKYVDKIPLTHDAIPYNDYISRDHDPDKKRGWKTLPLKLTGKITEIGRLHCPKTCSLLDIPIIFNATVSILQGKRHIPIHAGYFKGFIRYLFCVIEPKNNHAFIYINKEKYIFKANEGILWDDIFPHEVYNMSDDDRVCIYVDVLRKFENKLGNYLFKKLIHLSKFSSAVKKVNDVYERKPVSLDDIPSL